MLDKAENGGTGIRPGSKIAVVGAGIAGLACASMLREYGYEVVILEARDRTGGRIHTVQDFGLPVDLGASWLHGGPQNPLRKVAEKNKVITHPTDYRNLLAYSDGRTLSVADLDLAFCQFEKALRTWTNVLPYFGAWLSLHLGIGVSCTSVGTVVDRAAVRLGRGYDQAAVRLARAALGSAYALPLDEVSLTALLRHSSVGADEAGCVDGRLLIQNEPFVLSGMKTVADSVGRGLDIQLNVVVERVMYRRGHVSIKTSIDRHEANAAVITLPLGVLKEDGVVFEPPLPESYRIALNRLQMGVYNKVALEFPHAFWPLEPDLFALLDPSAAVPFFVNMHLYTKRPILLGLAGGRPGRAFTGRNASQIVTWVMHDLRTAFGNHVPTPVQVRATDWVSDPFARGSFSTMPLGATGREPFVLSEPIENTLFLAGEATHPTDSATVHGAYLSGLRAASQIGRGI